jgi:hypothetical protein
MGEPGIRRASIQRLELAAGVVGVVGEHGPRQINLIEEDFVTSCCTSQVTRIRVRRRVVEPNRCLLPALAGRPTKGHGLWLDALQPVTAAEGPQ